MVMNRALTSLRKPSTGGYVNKYNPTIGPTSHREVAMTKSHKHSLRDHVGGYGDDKTSCSGSGAIHGWLRQHDLDRASRY